jgi:hypothetical protein
MLKWFYNLEQLTDEQRVQMRTADNYLALRRLYAAGHPTFETAKWLYKEINPNPEQAANIFLPEPHEPNYFIKVCTSGNVELANWLYFEIVPNDQLRHDLFQSIISNESFYRCFTGLMGSFDIAKWLYFNAAQSLERRNKLIESNFDKITSHYRLFGCNNMTTMKWFYSLLSSTMQSRFLKEINPRSTPPSPADLPFYSWIKSTIISKLKEKYQEVKGKFSTSFQGDEKYHRHYKEFNDDMGIQLFSNKNNKTQSSYDDSDLILKKY